MTGLEGELMDNGHSLWVITDMISEGESVGGFCAVMMELPIYRWGLALPRLMSLTLEN